jgi:membrane-associated PAP2 superfamily phosphatase
MFSLQLLRIYKTNSHISIKKLTLSYITRSQLHPNFHPWRVLTFPLQKDLFLTSFATEKSQLQPASNQEKLSCNLIYNWKNLFCNRNWLRDLSWNPHNCNRKKLIATSVTIGKSLMQTHLRLGKSQLQILLQVRRITITTPHTTEKMY